MENPCDTKNVDFLTVDLFRNLAGDQSSYCHSKIRSSSSSGLNPSITSFSVLSPTIQGTIKDTDITINVSYSNLTSLTAGFVYEGVSVKIDGVEQTSGVSVNDFTLPKTYTVTAKDGTSKNYKVTVVTLSPPSSTATRVYGQASFISGTPSTSATGLNAPFKVAIGSGGLYVADQQNNRALFFSGTSTTATRVYGQNGNFTTANTGTVSPTEFYGVPGANVPDVAVDGTGVYITDIYGNRVLYFPDTSTTATRIYGQNGNFTTTTSGTTASTLTNPEGIAFDTTGVYIADSLNHRVLFFPGNSTTATRVYGQGGSFTSNTVNNGGVSANSLSNPRGIHVDSDGVYVADTDNNRILFFPGTSTTATRVYGQNGNFTTANTGASTDLLDGPWFVTSFAGNVYISDRNNHRILSYEKTSTTATRVWGQTDFVSSTTGLSASKFNFPYGMDIDLTGLYVADRDNHRVLFFPR
ncbi:hypothetical protein LPTSP3_g11620 [Leptospira kobayashii]|uniref:NHL repeat protein n=1 Tax=Leptospira kobayashii TaxID=1917830 RepID=A0ABM7UHS3_9LEPT|nr:hypothetical protein LPTSP3_g11620 [Leptospira kobayashii]